MINVERVVLPDPEDRPPAVLIVEDETLIRLALSGFLQDCGFNVFEARNAAEALTALQSGELQIDVVLTDVRMPGEMDGFGLARWIRQNVPGLPVLITSGDSTKAQVAENLCEKTPILPKPHDFKLVLARIRTAIDSAKTATRSS